MKIHLRAIPLMTFTCLALALTARAQVFTSDPSLPVLYPTGQYANPLVKPTYGGGGFTVLLTNVFLKPLGPVTRTPSGPDEIEAFSSQLDAIATVIPLGVSPVSASGSMQTIAHGKIGNITGTFSTEMLSLNLSGASPFGPFMIRESPTLPSLGVTTITDIGGGLYRIDSFFDVFTELSVDGGATWIPDTTGPARLTLSAVPEPAPGILAALALGLAALRRCRRRS